MHCACANWPYFHFRWKIWRHHRVPRPRYGLRRENVGDSHTFKAYIGLLNICMGFQALWPKMGVLWGNIGEGMVRYLPPTNSFFLLGVRTSLPILVKIDQEMWPWECSETDKQTDTLTDWQTQTDFIICPMLYAIAMGQITSFQHRFRSSH